MPEIQTTRSCGDVTIAHVSSLVSDSMQKAMCVHLTFKESLNLQFGLGQSVARSNACHRRTKEGRRVAAELCIYPHHGKITLNDGRLKRLDDCEPEEEDARG